MTAHELARKLLEGPDWPVCCSRGRGYEEEISNVGKERDHYMDGEDFLTQEEFISIW